MSIRGDSYGSVAEVRAFTRHLLDGEADFNYDTRPTKEDVEKFIDRASAILNTQLEQIGLTSPVTNSTAKLACDNWVVDEAAAWTELTQRGSGYSGSENTRPGSFLRLQISAERFCKAMALGFKHLGVEISHGNAEGLKFTGIDDQDERDDPSDSTLEQPLFKRGLFDAYSTDADDEEE